MYIYASLYKDDKLNRFKSSTCGDMSPDLKNFKLGEASTKNKIKRNIY